MKILLVEDDPSQRYVFTHVLEKEGHEVTQTDSLEAAKKAEGGPWDLVLSDYKLSGGELGTSLVGWHGMTPLLIVSGYEPPVGYHGDWLVKPFDLTLLTAKLKDYQK